MQQNQETVSLIDDHMLESLAGEMRLIAEKMHFYLATTGYKSYTNFQDELQFKAERGVIQIQIGGVTHGK